MSTLTHPQSAGSAALATRIAIVDTDIHHAIRSNADLLPYLSAVNRERLTRGHQSPESERDGH